MRQFISEFLNFFRKGDMVLLSLALILTGYGCMIIASATNVYGTPRYVIIQLFAHGGPHQQHIDVIGSNRFSSHKCIRSIGVDGFADYRQPATRGRRKLFSMVRSSLVILLPAMMLARSQ